MEYIFWEGLIGIALLAAAIIALTLFAIREVVRPSGPDAQEPPLPHPSQQSATD